MNDLTTFSNPEFGQVRTVEINGTPWLVGKDVAIALGYKNPQRAIRDHVDTEDQGVTKTVTPSGEQEMLIINESGLYSLILSSKMPKAKAFKHWVTSEVLPAIHKTGAYKSFQTKQHIEQLEATNTRLNAAIQAVSEAKAALANVTAMRDDFIKDRDDFKEHFQKWKSLYGGACDRLRRAENLVQQAQGELNSRIDQLSIVAFGLPGFDEIMQTAMEIALPDKKEE
ncbi:MAG: Bro-N domain-containing protein [Faecalibacterium sp.]|nr:Bro-N domain-containing protein [Faecalibacterium sp.]